MNTRIAKKVLSRMIPPDQIPSERMQRAHAVYCRALRRGTPERMKWAARSTRHTTTRETKRAMMLRKAIIFGAVRP